MRRSAIILALVAVLVGAVVAYAVIRQPDAQFAGNDITGAQWARAFALSDHNGQRRTLADFRGKVVLVFFGYTNCPDACPLSMERLRELNHSGLVAADDVAYVMISVDGERDTPAAMKAFLAKYSSEFIGLTADPSRVQPIAQQFSAAFFKGSRHAHDGGYEVLEPT